MSDNQFKNAYDYNMSTGSVPNQFLTSLTKKVPASLQKLEIDQN